MGPVAWMALEAFALFVGTIICLETGYRLALPKLGNTELTHEGIGAVEASVFALLGLLLGFSFAGATSRFDSRRQLVIQEANAIGTAYLRLDLLPAANQAELRPLFREYLETRLAVYRKFPDLKAVHQELDEVSNLQQKLWSMSVNASRADPTQEATRLLLPAVNEMIDVTTFRTVALYTQLPALIFGLLIGVALLSGLLVGYAMAKRRERSWLHMIVYAAIVSVTIYAVADLDHPRSGLIRLDEADATLFQLRDSMR